ncbi:MAG: TCR/Tet family MFS transporter [Verrucomicrobia bacterium]|nr:TCR/Tet family MFS transporter [Verrucomicrobiota bacterium]
MEAPPPEPMPSAAPSGPRRGTVMFIFVTVLLDVLAFGVLIPVLPKLVEFFKGGDTAEAAKLVGVFGTVWAVMQFFFSPIFGALSDRFGRRPVILASNFGLGLDFILMALAPNLWWLFVGRVISGITGASFSTAQAYIADVTPPEKRAAGFGMLGAAFGLGFVLGPAVGGILGSYDLRLPFWVAAALTLVNVCYGYFILPESLAPENRRPFSWKRANPVGSIALLRSQPQLIGLASVGFLVYLAHAVYPSVFVLFASHRFQWTERDVGFTLAFVGILNAAVQGGLVRVFVKRFGERPSVLLGLFFAAVGYAWFGLAPTGFWLLWAVPAGALAGLYGPAAQGLMTKAVAANQQGQLQGATASVNGIAGLIGPLLFTFTFAHFIRPGASVQFEGAPFVLAALLTLTALGLAAFITRPAAQPTAP